jgi:hypothetical protein
MSALRQRQRAHVFRVVGVALLAVLAIVGLAVAASDRTRIYTLES